VMRTFLKTAALLVIVSVPLALAVVGVGQRHMDPLQVGSMHQWSDLSSLSAEDINRRTLKAAEACPKNAKSAAARRLR
jgi:hypothetical protein